MFFVGLFPLLIFVIFPVIWVIPNWRICSRTGLSKWLLLMLLIPVVGWFFPWFIAFLKWPKDAAR